MAMCPSLQKIFLFKHSLYYPITPRILKQTVSKNIQAPVVQYIKCLLSHHTHKLRELDNNKYVI